MKKIKILSLLSAAVFAMSAPLVVFAADNTYGTGDSSGTISVTADVVSSYSITLPASVALELQNDGTYSKNYTVGVKANIQNSETVKVTPTPKFDVFETNHGDNVQTSGSVTQTATAWRNSPSEGQLQARATEYVTTTGTITIDLNNIEGFGHYYGTATFTFGIE